MRRLSLAVLMLLAAPLAARAQGDGGISDAEIRAVVERVAHHQLQPVIDGDYPAVTSLEQAQGAKPPQGIAWFYPQGVMLYGMARSTDLTHDRAVDQFACGVQMRGIVQLGAVEHEKRLLLCGRQPIEHEAIGQRSHATTAMVSISIRAPGSTRSLIPTTAIAG